MSTKTSRICAATLACLLVPVLAGVFAAPAMADDSTVIASDTVQATATVVAADRSPVTSYRRGPSATASVPKGIVVTGHNGYPVSISAAGEPTLRVSRPGSAPARFTGLTAGTTYLVSINDRPVAKVTAVQRPRAAYGLTVRTTTQPDTVRLTWKHATTKATGGRAISYRVSAQPQTGAPITTTVRARTSATLSGLDPHTLYTFTVTPTNSAGSGRSTKATMTRPLGGDRPTTPVTVPVTPVSPPTTERTQPAPAPVAPAPAPQPTTRTIYVCPDGYVEDGNQCRRTLPYTYTRQPYTFHKVPTGPAPIWDKYETATHVCPSGYNTEDFGWIAYCVLYGPVPTISVKDDTPAGFTDNGTEWIKRDAIPVGYVDDGTCWVRIVPKEARIVPA